MKKNPWLAAFLNFMFFGGGTLYNGRNMFGGALMTVGGMLVQGFEIKISPLGSNALPALYPFLISGLVILKIGLGVAAYQEAKALSAG